MSFSTGGAACGRGKSFYGECDCQTQLTTLILYIPLQLHDHQHTRKGGGAAED
jgi:hypothetical protein